MAAAGTTCVAEAQQEEEGMQQEPSGGGGDTWAHFVRRSLGEQRANRDVLRVKSRRPFLLEAKHAAGQWIVIHLLLRIICEI